MEKKLIFEESQSISILKNPRTLGREFALSLVCSVLFLTCILNSIHAHASTDFENIKNAEWARLSKNPVAIFKSVEPIQNPDLMFWKNTLTAEAYSQQNNPQKALVALADLKSQIAPMATLTEDGYSWLYKRALITSLQAKMALGQSSVFETTQLRSFYPLDDSLMATLDESVPLSTLQKIHKLKILSLNYAFKKAKGLIDTNTIAQSSLSPEEKCEVFLLQGRALKSFAEFAEDATNALQSIHQSTYCNNDQKAKALFYLGNIGKINKNSTLLVKSYENLAKNYSDHYLADDALNALGEYFKTSNPSLSQKYYKKLDDSNAGDMRSEYFFNNGFEAYKTQNYKAALSAFDKLSKTTTPINETYVQGLYWQARTLEKLNPKNVNIAKANYQKIVRNYPFAFYAVLAAKQLGTSIIMPHFQALEGQAPIVSKNEFTLMNSFNSISYSQGARVMLDLALLKNPELKTTHQEFLAKCFIESENYREAIEIAALHFGSGTYGPVETTQDPLMSAFYPHVFHKEMTKGYQVSGLPFGAIEGISREESLFNKDATSWVGAKGLMQLMPSTARMIQNAVMENTPTTELTHPLNNILLGSHYLKLMKQKFSGQMPLAIMAYNAGPGNVNKWLKNALNNKKSQSLDMFIEEIPFSETKGYVKRVMRSMNVYGAMYNEDFFKKNKFSLNITQSSDV